MRPWLLAIFAIVLVLALHVPAQALHWYYFMWWYDVMMHTLGGAAMGCLGWAFWCFVAPASFSEKGKGWVVPLVFVLGFVGLIGIAWEWFECFVDGVILPILDLDRAQFSIVDTMLDFYFDLMGGLTAYVVIRYFKLTKPTV